MTSDSYVSSLSLLDLVWASPKRGVAVTAVLLWMVAVIKLVDCEDDK